jgi:ATP-dependent protease ClpP protease subunit
MAGQERNGKFRRRRPQRSRAWLVGLSLLAGAASAAAEDTPLALWEQAGAPAVVTITGARLSYVGEIMETTNPELFKRYAAATPAPRILSITSRGGSARAAIQMAHWIADHKLEVEVEDYCLSSCSNYLLAAGTRTRIAPHALLGWHGGATWTGQGITNPPGTSASELEQQARFYAQLLEEETALFRRLGVEQRMTVVGLDPRYAQYHDQPLDVWDFSLEDLIALGIRQLEVMGGGPWNPPRKLPSGIPLYRVSLADHPELKPRPRDTQPVSPPGASMNH